MILAYDGEHVGSVEDPMLILKTIMFLIAGLLSVLAMRHVMREMEAAKARAKVRPSQRPQHMRRLRQDPRTGVYYPEN
jgi:hypothetical protein